MENTNEPSRDDHRQTDHSTSETTLTRGENTNPQSDKQNAKPSREKKHPLEWAIFVFVVLTALCTIAAACYSRKQWITAEDTEKRQLRAYVIIKTNELEKFGEGNFAQSIVENVGQTPVYNGSWLSGINVSGYPMAGIGENADCKVIMSQPDAGRWFFGKFIYPDKDRKTAFTVDEIKSIKDGIAAVYFHGRICYVDIFNETRYTDFCMYWKWQNGSLAPANYCPRGNGADQD